MYIATVGFNYKEIMSTINFETSLVRRIELKAGGMETWESADVVLSNCSVSMYRTFREEFIYYAPVAELNGFVILTLTNPRNKRVVMGLYMYDESDIEFTHDIDIDKAFVYLSKLDCVNRQIFRGTVEEVSVAVINISSNPLAYYTFNIEVVGLGIKSISLYETTVV